MDKINNIGLSRLLTSVYDFDGFTTQEVWSKISQKINIIIEHFNYIDSKINNEIDKNKIKFDYLLGEGLNEQVAKELIKRIEDDTISHLINDTILKEINSKIDTIINNHLDINIRDYGAKCDGMHDDTQAIKKAIEVLKNHGGKCSLNLTVGTILISENLVIPPLVTIYGQGIYKTTIKAKQTVSILLDITDNNIYNNEFYDFTVDGSNINGITGILFGDSTNKINDENCKFQNILIANCTDSFKVGENNRGNRFININIEHCVNGMLINGTDNVISNCVVSSIQNDGITVNGSNNHVMLCKAFYCDKNGMVINGQLNSINCEVQENGLNGLVVNGFMNNIEIVADTNGRINQSFNILVDGYKNIIRGLAGFNEELNGNIKSHIKINPNAVFNNIDIHCHGNRQYINEECISSSNHVVLSNKKYLKNLLNEGMQLESIGVGQSFLKYDNFYNNTWLINYNKNLNQGCYYKKEINLENNNKKYDYYLKANVRGGNICVVLEFYNDNNKIKTITSDDLTIYHNNDSVLHSIGDIPKNANKCTVVISLYSTHSDGYSEAVLLDYGFNVY